MDWSPQQDAALKAIHRWLRDPSRQQVYRMFGYAGGKTTLAAHLARDIDGPVCFLAFTGKAASVLRDKGCSATTIHSAIYHFVEIVVEETKKQQEAREKKEQEAREKGQEEEEIKKIGKRRMIWTLNENSIVRQARLIVVDECSMVNTKLAKDLLSFRRPVLVIGDPAQLPPIEDQGFFIHARPDVLLTEIHRQARDNPIIEMATIVRQRGELKVGKYGESEVFDQGTRPVATLDFEQVLVGKNRTRKTINGAVRTMLGFKGPLPQANDRMICLRNDHKMSILNGTIWHVVDAGKPVEDLIGMTLGNDEGRLLAVTTHRSAYTFDEEPIQFIRPPNFVELDFAYAITVHKAQGSQWETVLLHDEKCFGDDHPRWLYTGLTRASKRVTVVNHKARPWVR